MINNFNAPIGAINSGSGEFSGRVKQEINQNRPNSSYSAVEQKGFWKFFQKFVLILTGVSALSGIATFILRLLHVL